MEHAVILRADHRSTMLMADERDGSCNAVERSRGVDREHEGQQADSRESTSCTHQHVERIYLS